MVWFGYSRPTTATSEIIAMYTIYDSQTKLPVPGVEPTPTRVKLVTLRNQLNKLHPGRFFIAKKP